MTEPRAKKLLKQAYIAGFNVSGEGWNGEYPYGDRGTNPAKDLRPHFEKWYKSTQPTKVKEK
jgi:hypothetical protein